MIQTGEKSLNLTNNSELKKFGLLVGAVLSVIGVFPAFRGRALNLYLVIIGVIFILLAVIAPGLLSPVYKGWMKVGKILGRVNTFLILSIIFYLFMTPLGFARKIFGSGSKKFAHGSNKNSYWIKRNPVNPKEEMKRTF